MKIRIAVTVAVMFLTACVYSQTKPKDPVYPPKPGTGGPTNDPIRKDLTKEIREALRIPNAVIAIVLDSNGQPFLLLSEGARQHPGYPIASTEIQGLFNSTILQYKGSHCFDYIDSTGSWVQSCAPPFFH